MRILHVVPGSGGGFYCQNCIRDVGLVREMHRAGHEAMFVPLYLPLMETPEDEQGIRQAPIFYGAIGVYLAQKVPLFRWLPGFLRRSLDAPALLRRAARRAGTTQAGGLGDLTLSVLKGREGRQREALDRLLEWMAEQPAPDVIHFSNALLLGLSPALRKASGAAVVCSLQDEDTWLDALPPAYREPCWDRIRHLCREVDLLIPASEAYAAVIRPRLELPDARCRVIPPGIDVRAFSPGPPPPPVPVLGFLSEFSENYGLDVLFDAFVQLREQPGLENLRLRFSGGNPRAKSPFLKRLRDRIDASAHAGAVEFVDDFRQDSRTAFLRSLTALSVPSVRPEAFGLFLVEAMACGVPVVQPEIGGYPEVVKAAGGGVIYRDRTAGGLAAALYPVLTDRALAAGYGRAGRAGVVKHFDIVRIAGEMMRMYEHVLRDRRQAAAG